MRHDPENKTRRQKPKLVSKSWKTHKISTGVLFQQTCNIIQTEKNKDLL